MEHIMERRPPPKEADTVVPLSMRQAAIGATREDSVSGEKSVDIVHSTEITERIAGQYRTRPMRIYERFVYKAGSLEMYFLFHPGLGITSEERAAMRGGEATPRSAR